MTLWLRRAFLLWKTGRIDDIINIDNLVEVRKYDGRYGQGVRIDR